MTETLERMYFAARIDAPEHKLKSFVQTGNIYQLLTGLSNVKTEQFKRPKHITCTIDGASYIIFSKDFINAPHLGIHAYVSPIPPNYTTIDMSKLIYKKMISIKTMPTKKEYTINDVFANVFKYLCF